MKLEDKTNEIKNKLDEVMNIILGLNEEVHKEKNKFNCSRFMDLNEQYKKSARQLNELFRERSVLMEKWIDDLNNQLKRFI